MNKRFRARKPTTVREKQHRLPRECYQGEVTAMFTLCLRGSPDLFTREQVISVFVKALEQATERYHSNALAYCFMPDHLHVMLQGKDESADLWKTIADFKQRTGFWLKNNYPYVRWQKDFYDHIVRKNEDLKAQIRYLLENPVRKGLVNDWRVYPFLGAIGYDLENIL